MFDEMTISNDIRWIGFDLDDTLHHFRRASAAAAEAVFSYIEEEFGTPVGDLRRSYAEILKDGQSKHFVDSKSSVEYRSERFTRLMNDHSILASGHIAEVLEVYDRALEENLQLTDGAENALRAAKERGFGVFVVSEGPHDAQVLTIQRLGIASYVDALVTSSREGLSKSGGLFNRTLERLDVGHLDVLFVGDSLERDIIPAKRAGIQAIQLSPSGAESGGISSLEVLANAVKSTRPRRHYLFVDEKLKL